MSEAQTRRSVSTTAITYWRLRELQKLLDESGSGIVDRLINELADRKGILKPPHAAAVVANRKLLAQDKPKEPMTTAENGEAKCRE